MNTPASDSPWAPLHESTFRSLWLAILAANIGTWIHDVAAAWLMAEQTNSPLMVAAVQAATTLPIVLLALLAGALADIVDRRRYLIVAQLWMLFIASALALLAHLDRLGPMTLLVMTFALGIGAAMAMPAQSAITPELVPRAQLAPAVALNSISINIARSVGPALGGLIIAQWGIASAFAVNAVSFLGIVVVLWRWRRAASVSTLPAETFGSALRAGLRYAARASVFQSVLLKSASFFVFASALTALLPIIVRGQMRGGPGTYGLLLGFIGVGAISGALLLPRLRARFDRDQLMLAATLLCAATLMGLAHLRNLPLLAVVMLLNGAAWICMLSSLQIAAQTAVPAWVRARALSLYIVTFSAGMAAGSLLWGTVAQRSSPTWALTIASVCAAIAGIWALRYKLGMAETLDLAPSAHWPQPVFPADAETDRGPVLVTIEYRIAGTDREQFLQLMRTLGSSRRRDGATDWGILEDTAQAGTHLEYFILPSWLDHLRQHERVTGEEKRLQQQIRELHQGDDPPHLRHFIGGLPLPPGNPAHHHHDQ